VLIPFSAGCFVFRDGEKMWRLRFRILDRVLIKSLCRMFIIEIKLW